MDQTLLKSEPHHLYHIYWSLWTQTSRNKYLLVICKVFRMFLNILTGDDKYSLLNRDNLNLRHYFQMQLPQKQKNFLNFFFHFWNLHYVLNIFKQKWHSQLMYFRNYGHRKMLLDKSLKSLVSENPLTSNMVSGPNTVEIWTTPTLPYLLITVNATKLEKASLSDKEIFKTVSLHIDCQWQIFSSL